MTNDLYSYKYFKSWGGQKIGGGGEGGKIKYHLIHLISIKVVVVCRERKEEEEVQRKEEEFHNNINKGRHILAPLT